MHFTTHFHTNYTSSGVGSTYTKVSIEIDGFGMFCVIRNKNTGRIQRQAYLLLEYGTRNYIGLSHKGYFNGVDSLKQAWAGLNDADKSNILDCVNNLDSGFRRFVRKYKEISGTTPPDENEVHSYLNMLVFVMNGDSTTPTSNNDAENATTVGIDGESTSRNWVEAKISELSSNDLENIMKMIYDKENPEEGVEYKGNTYRVMRDDSGRMVVRMLQKDATCENGNSVPVNDNEKQPKPVAVATPPKPKRRTKRMAFMTNNENLTEFVNGCYYKLVKEVNCDFVTILNDANEERTVSKSRVNLVDVYDQPPLEEAIA